jgi:hypothetical protein
MPMSEPDGNPRRARFEKFDEIPAFTVVSKPSMEAGFKAGRLGRNERRLSTYWALTTGTLVLCGLLLILSSNPLGVLVGWIGLAVGLIGLAATLRAAFGRPSSTTRARWNAAVGDGDTYNFGPRGITQVSREVATEIRWSAVNEIRDDGRILMFRGGGFQPRWLDRDAFVSDDQRSELIAYARARIADAVASRVERADPSARSVSYVQGWRDLPRHEKVGLAYGILGLVFSAYLLWVTFVIFSAGPDSANAGMWILALSLAFLAGSVLVTYRRIRTSRPLLGLGVTWTIGQDGLQTITTFGQISLQSWATIVDVAERSGGLELGLPIGQKIVIPSRAFADAGAALAFKSEIKQHITVSRGKPSAPR